MHKQEVTGERSRLVECSGEHVRKIWHGAPHCAFTDLIRFRDEWFCVFRESDSHVKGRDGEIRVLKSPDGEKWASTALIAEPDLDLRDPQLSETSDGRLMLLFAAVVLTKKVAKYETHAVFSPDGHAWSKPQAIGFPGQWLWRVTWHEGKAYGISREFIPNGDSKPGQTGHLLVSEDGITYRKLTEEGFPDTNESALHFSRNGRLTALVRRSAAVASRSALGISDPPYLDWQWRDIDIFIGGPRLIEIPGTGLLAGARHYPKNGPDFRVGGPPGMELAWVDEGSYEPFLRLPSGGDTSYPGFVVFENELWVSYYSSHEETTAIYLARIPLGELLRTPMPPT